MSIDFASLAVVHSRDFSRHIFLTVLPTWFAKLGVKYPETVTAGSLESFRLQVEVRWSEALDGHAAAKKLWERKLNELFALQAAKEPNEKRIKAKEAEVAEARIPKDEAFAVLMDARRADESARMVDAAWTGLARGDTAAFRWLVVSLLRTADYSPELRELRDVLVNARHGVTPLPDDEVEGALSLFLLAADDLASASREKLLIAMREALTESI